MTLVNFRDVADIVSPLAAGRLFRCGRPLDVTTTEARSLADLGIRTIVDLRGSGEATSGDWAAVTAEGVALRPVGTADNPAAATALPPEMTLGDLYVLLLDHRTAWLVAAIEAVAEGLPTLVNCTAGKDRTGMVVALILDLLGIDHDLIVADYQVTRDSLRSGTVARAAQGVVPPEAPAMLMDAPPEAMRTFLNAVTERGGAEDFLITHGLPADIPARLRTALLTKDPKEDPKEDLADDL